MSDWNRLRPWCLAGLIVLAALVFRHPLAVVVASSIQVDQYSQVLVVPPLALCLLYLDRKKLMESTSYNWVGGSLFLLLVLAFIAAPGALTSLDPSTALSLAVVGFALVCSMAFLFCYGLRAFRVEAFPLSFMVLMAPLPDSLREMVIAFLQQGSAVVTDWFFTASRIPFSRDGVVLALPTVTIEIAKECSGIRSSMVLFLGGLVLAHLFLRSNWSKLALMVLMAPLTIVKNGIRIYTLTTLGMYVDEGFLTGRLHRNGGIVFFGLAFGALWAMVWILQQLEDRMMGTASASQPATTKPA